MTLYEAFMVLLIFSELNLLALVEMTKHAERG
jgi:hypothetical protein